MSLRRIQPVPVECLVNNDPPELLQGRTRRRLHSIRLKVHHVPTFVVGQLVASVNCATRSTTPSALHVVGIDDKSTMAWMMNER
jgi:hypothetical protein